MSCWEKTKLVGPLLLFNILLPTWDVFSDVMLSVNLIVGGHQSCSIEEENIQTFKQELDECLRNPSDYCKSNSNGRYLCQEDNVTCLWCPKKEIFKDVEIIGCPNTASGIREIYRQCLTDNTSYCSNHTTYHGICVEETKRHYKFAFLLLGKYY